MRDAKTKESSTASRVSHPRPALGVIYELVYNTHLILSSFKSHQLNEPDIVV